MFTRFTTGMDKALECLAAEASKFKNDPSWKRL